MERFEASPPHPTLSGRFFQPHAVGWCGYRIRMGAKNSKTVLWDNVLALMLQHVGKENLSWLARELRTSATQIARLKDQETSVGVDMLDRIAARFRLETWQLLAPELGKTATSSAESEQEKRLLLSYRKLLQSDREDTLARVEQRVDELDQLAARVIAERAAEPAEGPSGKRRRA